MKEFWLYLKERKWWLKVLWWRESVLKTFLHKIPDTTVKRLPIIFFLMLLTFFTVIYLTSTRTVVNLASNWGVDYAMFLQTAYNTAHGDILFLTIAGGSLPEENYSFLVSRFAPIMLIVALIYKIFSSPFTLMAVQTFSTCLASVPLYLLARLKTKNDYFALAIVYSFFLHPFINTALLQEFRIGVLSIIFFFSAFLFYERKKILLMYISLALAATTQEQSSIYISLLGLWIWRKGNISKKHGLCLFLGGLTLFISIVFIIQPALFQALYYQQTVDLSPRTSPLQAYNNLSFLIEDFQTAQYHYIHNFISLKRIEFYLKIIGSLAFLPLFDTSILIGIPEILQNAALGEEYAVDCVWHNVYFTTFLFIAATYSLGKINRNRIKILLSITLIFSSTVFGYKSFYYHIHNIKMYGFKNLWTNNTRFYNAINAAKNHISRNASVAAQHQLTVLMSERKYVYWDIILWRTGKYKDYLPDYFVFNAPALEYFKVFTEEEQKIFLPIFLANYTLDAQYDFVYVYKHKLHSSNANYIE